MCMHIQLLHWIVFIVSVYFVWLSFCITLLLRPQLFSYLHFVSFGFLFFAFLFLITYGWRMTGKELNWLRYCFLTVARLLGFCLFCFSSLQRIKSKVHCILPWHHERLVVSSPRLYSYASMCTSHTPFHVTSNELWSQTVNDPRTAMCTIGTTRHITNQFYPFPSRLLAVSNSWCWCCCMATFSTCSGRKQIEKLQQDRQMERRSSINHLSRGWMWPY